MKIFKIVVLLVISFVLFLMPLSPVFALNLDNIYLAQVGSGYWSCTQTQDCIGTKQGIGSTETDARNDLDRNIRNAFIPPGTPCNVIQPTKCSFIPTGSPPPPDGGGVPPTPPALPRDPGTSPGKYRLSDGTIFSSNGTDAYCTYQNMEHWSFAAGKASLSPADSLPPFRNDGPCPVVLPAGNYRQLDGLIFKSNGKDAFCAYQKVPTGFIRQLNAPVPYDRLMRNDGLCAGQ